MKMVVRPMRLEDVPALARMEQEIFSQPWSEKQFADLLTRSYTLYYVAERTGEILGFAGLTRLGNEGDVDKVMVRETCRGQGIASLIMEELLEEGRKRGIEEFTLEVRAGNIPAIRLYEKFGFVSEGIRPGFYEKPSEDALIMWMRQ